MKEPLHIKTYFASSVQAALTLAKREMGEDAMLLNTRQSPAEARHLGQYEAIFATNDVLPGHARGTTDPEPAATQPDSEYMESQIKAEPILAHQKDNRTIAAFIGPTGRGKTTTLVKLAVTHGLSKRKPVRIFSADYLRAAAPQQLRTLSAILGVTFESFSSPATLDHALRHPLPGLTLIDTPGFGPRDHDASAALARCLTAHSAIDSHLVLRADSSSAALSTAIDRFACFRPARLLFTGLDEVSLTTNLFDAASRSKLPVSFLANGQSIPEDIEPASTARIVELTLGSLARANFATV